MPIRKPFWKSLTFYGLLFVAAGMVMGSIASGQVDPGIMPVLADILQAVGVGGALVGRTRATQPLGVF